jgi:hypothetical protein
MKRAPLFLNSTFSETTSWRGNAVFNDWIHSGVKRVLTFKMLSAAERFPYELVHQLAIGTALDFRKKNFHHLPEILSILGL